MRGDVVGDAIAAAYEVAARDKDQEFYDNVLLQIWDEMEDDLSANPTQTKMINFSRLSTYLMREHRDQFVKVLTERLGVTPEDLAEEKLTDEETPK